MGPYYIPRNVNDEGRILFIFTRKSMVTTTIGAGIGAIFYFLFSLLKMNFVGVIFVAIFALIGFCVGTFKVPEITSLKMTRKVGGENIDEIILRAIKFKFKKNKIYIQKEVMKDE